MLTATSRRKQHQQFFQRPRVDEFTKNQEQSYTSDELEMRDRIKCLETRVMQDVELSCVAAASGQFKQALHNAQDALVTLDELKAAVLQERRSSSSASYESELYDERNDNRLLDDEHYNHNDNDQNSHRISKRNESQPMTTGVNLFDLSIMVKSNLATQLQNNGQLSESLEIYTQICKLAVSNSSSVDASCVANGGGFSSAQTTMSNSQQLRNENRYLLYRFGMNIGNILFEMNEFQRALKYYRLTLDRLSSSSNRNLRIKLMNNISLALVAMKNAQAIASSAIDVKRQKSQPNDHVTSLQLLLADNVFECRKLPDQMHSEQTSVVVDREITNTFEQQVFNSNHHKFGLNLITCQYATADLNAMQTTFNSLIQVGICHNYGRVLSSNMLHKINNDYANLDSSNLLSASSSLTMKQDIGVKTKQPERENSQSKQIVQRTNHDSQSTITLEHVQSITHIDALERVISMKEDEITRCLIMSCQLMVDLDIGQLTHDDMRHNNQRASFTNVDTAKVTVNGKRKHNFDDDHEFGWLNESGRGTSVLEKCIKLCEQSEYYASLADDIKTNIVSRLLTRPDKMRTALIALERLCLEQQVGATTSSITTSKASIRTGNDQITESSSAHYNKSASWTIGSGGGSLVSIMQIGADSTVHKRQSSSLVVTNISLLHLLKNDLQTALELNKKALAMNERNVEGWINMANCYVQLNELDHAEFCYLQAMHIEPNNWIANYNLILLSNKRSRHVNDLPSTTRALFITPLASDFAPLRVRKMALHYAQLAELYRESNMNRKSSDLYKDMLNNLKQQSPELYVKFSKILSEEQSTDPTPIIVLQTAQRVHTYHLPLAQRLIALYIATFQYKEAESVIVTCIKNRPDQVRWYSMLAECYRRSADYKKAVSLYKITIDLFPLDTSCLKALLKLTEEIGLQQEAKECRTKLERLSKQL